MVVQKLEMTPESVEGTLRNFAYDPKLLELLAEDMDLHMDLARLVRDPLSDRPADHLNLLELLLLSAENGPASQTGGARTEGTALRMNITRIILKSGLLKAVRDEFLAGLQDRLERDDVSDDELTQITRALKLLLRGFILLCRNGMIDDDSLVLWNLVDNVQLPGRFWLSIGFAQLEELIKLASDATALVSPPSTSDLQSSNEGYTGSLTAVPGEESLPSPPSLPSHFVDVKPEDSAETNELCQASGRLSVAGSLKKIYDNVFESDNDTDLPEYLRIESLPWPVHELIFHHLRSDGDLKDLDILAKVSPLFRSEVKRFLRRNSNRPGLDRVVVRKNNDGLEVVIVLFPTNIAFTNLDNLDWSRFKRLTSTHWTGVDSRRGPSLTVTLRGLEDPIIDQIIDILSTTIVYVDVGAVSNEVLLMEDLSLISRLFAHSTIRDLDFEIIYIENSYAPHIISIVSHVSNFLHIYTEHVGLSDPEGFISQITSAVLSASINCYDVRLFYGLPHSFWEKFINEKLMTGAADRVSIWYGDDDGEEKELTKAPVDLSHSDIWCLEWKKEQK